jgi:hypothetical protein
MVVNKRFFRARLRPQNKPAPPPPVPKGLVRALFVGINYVGTPYQLAGCINDANDMCAQVKTFFPATATQVITDQTATKPTRQAILNAFSWLTTGLRSGQNVLFHYSGHGGRVRDANGDEPDRQDECIYPLGANGRLDVITDDEIRAQLANKVPAGSKLFVVLDSCHSGSAVDLRYLWQAPSATQLTFSQDSKQTATAGTVVFLSGCADPQFAMDTVNAAGRPCGAMTMALLTTWRRYGAAIKTKYLLWDVRQFLRINGYTQIPQLSTGSYMDLSAVFDLRA